MQRNKVKFVQNEGFVYKGKTTGLDDFLREACKDRVNGDGLSFELDDGRELYFIGQGDCTEVWIDDHLFQEVKSEIEIHKDYQFYVMIQILVDLSVS